MNDDWHNVDFESDDRTLQCIRLGIYIKFTEQFDLLQFAENFYTKGEEHTAEK